MPAIVDENKKYKGISKFRDIEVLRGKQPPYTDEDIEGLLETVKTNRIVCSSPTCYSVADGNGGTGCGSCCDGA